MCCDGTFLAHANLASPEDVSIARAIGMNVTQKKGRDIFTLPCPAHRNCACTVYDRQRPRVCPGYKCRLLRRFEKGKIAHNAALVIIRTTKSVRDQMLAETGDKGWRDPEVRNLMRQCRQDLALRARHARLFFAFVALQLNLDDHFRKEPVFEYLRPDGGKAQQSVAAAKAP